MLNNLDSARKAYAERGRQLDKALAELNEKTRTVADMQPSLTAAKARMEASEELLRKHNNTVEKWAVNMRHSLNVGDVCPVCRQTISNAIPEESLIRDLYLQVKEQYNKDSGSKCRQQLIPTGQTGLRQRQDSGGG